MFDSAYVEIHWHNCGSYGFVKRSISVGLISGQDILVAILRIYKSKVIPGRIHESIHRVGLTFRGTLTAKVSHVKSQITKDKWYESIRDPTRAIVLCRSTRRHPVIEQVVVPQEQEQSHMICNK